MRQQLGPLRPAALDRVVGAAPLVTRLWDHDDDVWPLPDEPGPDRLGWLDAIDHTRRGLPAVDRLVAEIASEGITDLLLVGMGGAVVATRAVADLVTDVRLRLHLLDSTHPAAVARARDELDPDTWLVVVVSKSGTTRETRALFDRLYADVLHARGRDTAGRPFVVLTDPGSPLEPVARQRGVRAVISTNPRLAGRWSALDVVGMVPAALVGADAARVLDGAAPAVAAAHSDDLAVNTAARLGAVLAAAADAGRHHLVLVLPPGLAAYGRWIAHVVGESLVGEGRRAHSADDTGLVPQVVHHVDEPVQYGQDVVVVAWGDWPGLQAVADHGIPTVVLEEPRPESLAGGFFRWEFATAVAAALRGVDPFAGTEGMVAAVTGEVLVSGRDLPPPVAAAELLDRVDEADRLVLLAWVDPEGAVVDEVRRVAATLRRRYGIPVMVEVQPRALHTTSRLHVHGPPGGIYAVIVERPSVDVDLVAGGAGGTGGPADGFARLLTAQATAELEVLAAAGRRAGLVDLTDLART